MPTESKLLVKDSSVIFDLIDLKLLDAFFQLDYVIITTRQVVNEIKIPDQLAQINSLIAVGKLKIDEEGSFEKIYTLLKENPGLSYTDCSILECAIRRAGAVISADKSLRTVAREKNINVKGFLWIIEELIGSSIVSKDSAIELLKIYPTINKRVPLKEISTLISRLSSY